MRRLPDESRADEVAVISLWRHEMIRIMYDRIARHSDRQWFTSTLNNIIDQVILHILSWFSTTLNNIIDQVIRVYLDTKNTTVFDKQWFPTYGTRLNLATCSDFL